MPSSLFSIRLVSIHVVHPYSSIDTAAAWKKLRFILSVWSDFHVTDGLSLAVHAFASHVLMSFSDDGTLLPVEVNLFTSFKSPPFSVEMLPLWLNHMYFVFRWHGGLSHQLLVPDYVTEFRLRRVYLPEALCHRCSPRPLLFVWVSSVSFFCQLETVFFDLIYRRSKHVVKADDKQVWV